MLLIVHFYLSGKFHSYVMRKLKVKENAVKVYAAISFGETKISKC